MYQTKGDKAGELVGAIAVIFLLTMLAGMVFRVATELFSIGYSWFGFW